AVGEDAVVAGRADAVFEPVHADQRLVEMGMRLDEAGQGDEARSVDFPGGMATARGAETPAADEEVHRRGAHRAGVADDDVFGHVRFPFFTRCRRASWRAGKPFPPGRGWRP